jgi:hypothetical protein
MVCQILAILLGKNGKKKDCLTSCYIKQQIHPYLANNTKNCAPVTSVSATTTVPPWSDLPNISSLCFCLHKRMRNEQRTYSEAWICEAISKNKIIVFTNININVVPAIRGRNTRRLGHCNSVSKKKHTEEQKRKNVFLSIKIWDGHTTNLNIQTSVLT